MTKTGWSKLFEDPVTLPDDRKLVTLLDAGMVATEVQGLLRRSPSAANGDVKVMC